MLWRLDSESNGKTQHFLPVTLGFLEVLENFLCIVEPLLLLILVEQTWHQLRAHLPHVKILGEKGSRELLGHAQLVGNSADGESSITADHLTQYCGAFSSVLAT